MASQLHKIRNEGYGLLSLNPNELELRYTDWVAKVKIALADASTECGLEVDTIDTTAVLSLRQRTEKIIAVLELPSANAEPNPPQT